MNDIRLIAIGGSAGSLQVIMGLVAAIPHGFSTPLLLILHRSSPVESGLEELLAARTSLRVREVEEKEPVTPGTIYTCPSDYHVLIEKDHSFSLDYSERVNYSRPSIDVSFRAAADVYGKELLCLLLSGGNADGAEGMEYVKRKGGVTVVQDPDTAEVPFMPQCAIGRTKIDFILTPSQMPALLFPPPFIFS